MAVETRLRISQAAARTLSTSIQSIQPPNSAVKGQRASQPSDVDTASALPVGSPGIRSSEASPR